MSREQPVRQTRGFVQPNETIVTQYSDGSSRQDGFPEERQRVSRPINPPKADRIYVETSSTNSDSQTVIHSGDKVVDPLSGKRQIRENVRPVEPPTKPEYTKGNSSDRLTS
jgi:hypothetical protein